MAAEQTAGEPGEVKKIQPLRHCIEHALIVHAEGEPGKLEWQNLDIQVSSLIDLIA